MVQPESSETKDTSRLAPKYSQVENRIEAKIQYPKGYCFKSLMQL